MPKTSVKKSERPVEELTYEEALSELENIVEALDGDAPRSSLDDSIKLFERGQALAVRCNSLLESAQLKIQKLAGEVIVPFEEEDE